MISCAEVTQKYIETLGSAFHCESLGKSLRIVTPYLYPDNDRIEVFVEELPGGRVRVSDYGETLRGLLSQGLDVNAAQKRKDMVQTIAAGSAVDVRQGQLVREGTTAEIGEMIFDVITVSRGVSDLILTSRTFEPATFREEVAAALAEVAVDVEVKPHVVGRSGKDYRLDFHLPRHNQYIETLTVRQPGQLQGAVNRAVRIWFDINGELQHDNKVTLLNDVGFRWPDAEVRLLSNASIVTRWSARTEWLARIEELGRITNGSLLL